MPLSRPTSSAGGTEAVDDLFATHDALAVAELIKTRKLGARELLDGTLNRLRALNASLNAVTDFYEGALLEKSVAAAGEGPFQGVPYLIKQLMADCAGTPTTLGSRFFAKEPVAANDSAAVARMRRAGLVIVGRTNTSELGLAPTTEPAFGGADRKPVARRSLARRIVGRFRRRRGGAWPADGACHRRRRLDPHPGVAVRPVRAETVARAGEPGADRRDPGRRGRAALRVDLRARQRGIARCDGGRRARRSLSCAAVRLLPGGDPAPAGQAARGVHAQARGRRAARSRAGRRRRAHGQDAGRARPSCRGGRARLRCRGNGGGLRHGDVRQYLHQHRGARRRPRPGSGRSRAGDAPARRDRPGHQRPRVHPRRADLPPHRPPARPVLREIRRAAVAHHRAHAPAAGHGPDGRHARAIPAGPGADDPVHRRVQRHRRAGDVGAACLDRRRPADRPALRRPLRGGGDAVLAGSPTGERRAVARPPATGR